MACLHVVTMPVCLLPPHTAASASSRPHGRATNPLQVPGDPQMVCFPVSLACWAVRGALGTLPARGRHCPMLGASWGLGGLYGRTDVLAQDRRPLCSWTPPMCLSPGRSIPLPLC